MSPLRSMATLCAASCLMLLSSPAAAQLAPKTPVGNASAQGDRYKDLLKAQRCMDFMSTVASGAKLNDMKQNNKSLRQRIRQNPHQARALGANLHSNEILSALGTKHGKRGAFREAKYVGMPTNSGNRPSGWSSSDLFGADSTGFRGEVYRRYGTPRGAPRGTYNLSFVVLSDNDEVFVCIQGTEPTVFPSPKPTGNTMNNLRAAPVVLRTFDQKAQVHQGWATVAHHYHKLLVPILKRHGIAGKKLHITGHSQGAVMAGYITFLLAKNLNLPRGKRHRLVTLSAPRYGTKSFIRRFRRVLKNVPLMTVDALETVGDVVPGFWPLGPLPVGKTWRATPKEVGSSIGELDVWGHHSLSISGYHAQKIIDTNGSFTGTSSVVDTVGSTVDSTFAKTCPRGFKKVVTGCEATTCPKGYVAWAGRCASVCPAGTKRSATGVHCMTSTSKYRESVKKVWVGNFKKPKKYRKACPSGTSFSHDLAGYSYCKSGSCPSARPVRKGNMCHARCGGLKTDAFGNCVVVSKPRHTIAPSCPAGTRAKGPLCVK